MGLRECIFLGELNGMIVQGFNISSAYLYVKILEKVCIEAGLEFSPLTGHILIIGKALYSLCFSRKALNHLLNEVLCRFGLKPSKFKPIIYI